VCRQERVVQREAGVLAEHQPGVVIEAKVLRAPSAAVPPGDEPAQVPASPRRPATTARLRRRPSSGWLLSTERLRPIGFAGLGVKEIDLRPSQGGDLPQRVAAHPRRPAYHALLPATRHNPRQRTCLVSASSAPIRS
jgi:hypothetical protein